MLNEDRSGLRLSGLFIGDLDSMCTVWKRTGRDRQSAAAVPLPHSLPGIIHPLDPITRLFFGEDQIHLIVRGVRVDLADQVART